MSAKDFQEPKCAVLHTRMTRLLSTVGQVICPLSFVIRLLSGSSVTLNVRRRARQGLQDQPQVTSDK
jgi:hypothetical protein